MMIPQNMKKNLLLTGPPGCGKTTVLLHLAEVLRAEGHVVGGIICPEIRSKGVRTGFRIIDLLGGGGILSHVDLFGEDAPTVSRYGVNVSDIDRITKQALNRPANFFIVDEIGPMELKSRVFISEVERILESDTPMAAAIHYRTSWGFAGRVKTREDVEIILVTPANREGLPDSLFHLVSPLLGRHI
jgi:nucleoside-triphosphatase